MLCWEFVDANPLAVFTPSPSLALGCLIADRNAILLHMRERQEPLLIRTYAGHTNPRAANELFRKNLAKGQTGLSVAFDLPTQTGYSACASRRGR